MSQGLESSWQSHCQHLSTLGENWEKKGAQNLAGRDDGGIVGIEDSNMDSILYVLLYGFAWYGVKTTILFPFKAEEIGAQTGEVTLLMALCNWAC